MLEGKNQPPTHTNVENEEAPGNYIQKRLFDFNKKLEEIIEENK